MSQDVEIGDLILKRLDKVKDEDGYGRSRSETIEMLLNFREKIFKDINEGNLTRKDRIEQLNRMQ